MAEYDNRVRSYNAAATAVVDEGLRAYMLRVYNYMLLGLGLTGIASYITYLASVTSDPAAAAARLPNGIMLTSIGVALFTGPLLWVLMLGSLGLVFFLSFRISRMSIAAAQASFLVYAALLGVTFGSLFVVYTYSSIAQVFFITAATFGAMSLWGYTTKRDLTGFGSFLMMGLIGIIIASLVGMFWHNSALQWMISVLGVIIFTGLTAYDTQSIKESYYVGDDGTIAGTKAIMGALRLCLDLINLFIMLLRLLGDRR